MCPVLYSCSTHISCGLAPGTDALQGGVHVLGELQRLALHDEGVLGRDVDCQLGAPRPDGRNAVRSADLEIIIIRLLLSSSSSSPTWHWNIASSSSSTGEILRVQSSATRNVLMCSPFPFLEVLAVLGGTSATLAVG